MTDTPFKKLALRLDALPHGFPATEEGIELQILGKLFTAQEAELAAQLSVTPESAHDIARRIGAAPNEISRQLRNMARHGLIAVTITKSKLLYGLLPFVVGIYELQGSTLDGELAALFETYYRKAFGRTMITEPQPHRIIPVGEAIHNDVEIQPYENAAEIINNSLAWGVTDCICRKQKALIGDPCHHPTDVCLWLSSIPGIFDNSLKVRALSKEQALNTLQRAANAGLVHSTANNQQTIQYICNCCTCSCGFLRGMADLGIANVMARSAFISQVDADQCIGCENCLEHCQFDALHMHDYIVAIDRNRCVGCGVCVRHCPEEALSLVRRPDHEIKPIPVDEAAWGNERTANRGVDLNTSD